MKVIFYDEGIQIIYGTTEVVYWDIKEWEDDPTIVFSIANAVRLAYTHPDELINLLKTNEV